MAGEVFHIDTINVGGNLVVAPENARGVADFLREEAERGVDPAAMEDTGHIPVEAEVSGEQPTDEERAEAGEALATIIIKDERARAGLRKRALEQVIKEADRSRMLGGFLVNHDDKPDDPEKVAEIETEQADKAQESLELACANCHFRDSCRLTDNLELWLDVHPYKKSNRARPGATYVRKRESRSTLVTDLRADPHSHCEPQKRHQARRKLLRSKAS
jgi:hypothetical protein